MDQSPIEYRAGFLTNRDRRRISSTCRDILSLNHFDIRRILRASIAAGRKAADWTKVQLPLGILNFHNA